MAKGGKTHSALGSGSRAGASDRAKRALQNFFKRKEILDIGKLGSEHPDKQLAWVNYSKFKDHGFFHPNGWKVFYPGGEKISGAVKLGDQYDSKDGYGPKFEDGMLHRAEMVLAWMPKEEYEEMRLGEELMRNARVDPNSVSNLLRSSPSLREFDVSSNRTMEVLVEEEL